MPKEPKMYDYHKIYETAMKCQSGIRMKTPAFVPKNDYVVPRQVLLSKWSFSKEAIENTLDYIFHDLHHNCYLLCIHNNVKTIWKILNPTTSPDVKQALLRFAKNNNPKITKKQREYILSRTKGPMRLMQCILKPYSLDNFFENNEYLDFMQSIDLPDGLFILNLSDSTILKSNGEYPFPMVTKKSRINTKNKPFLPILSLSGMIGYDDITIPTYDDIFIAIGQTKIDDSTFIVDWDKKKIDKAVFRGGGTGCGYTIETNQRLHLASMTDQYPDMLDARIVAKGRTNIDSLSMKFDPIFGLGMMNTGMKSGGYLSMTEQSNYKYIVHVDGNVHAYRFLTTMVTGSLILRVKSQYTSWMDSMLKPNVHYVQIKSDLSDLIEKIEYCRSHEDWAKEIAMNGRAMAKKVLTKEYLQDAFASTMWAIRPKKSASVTRKNKSKSMSLDSPEYIDLD